MTDDDLAAAIFGLRRRESATLAMLRQIDQKISRLDAARKERKAALIRVRCELAKAFAAEQATPDHDKKR